jgi:phosphate/sulfate permease
MLHAANTERRCVKGVIGVGAFYCSLRWLSLGEAVSLWYITPLVSKLISAMLWKPNLALTISCLS